MENKTPDNTTVEHEAEDFVLSKKAAVPLVWLLPIIAFFISGWLIYKSASEKGLSVTIDFPTAEGLEVDKTKIRYLNVDVGKVSAISINDDLKTIRVTAEMNSAATRYLKDGTSFWVVRPQVSLGGVSGLNTLLSGAYIELKPGGGNQQQHFKGLIEPPVLKNNIEGKQYILETNDLGSMRPGTLINFHGIPVGEVLNHKLANEANAIHLTIFIKSPYDNYVRKNTRFWIDSGIDLSAGAEGLKLRTGPILSLLSGGIAFRTSPKDGVDDIKPEYSMFQLYETYAQSTQTVYSNTLKYVMYFNGSVRGLSEGAPVQLRGIPIGKVTDINLELHRKTAELRVPVIVELEPDRIESVDEPKGNQVSDMAVMDQLIKKGLRAQLQMGSLVTGQLLIDLDFHPESKLVAHDNHSVYPEFPTVASSLEEIAHSAQIIMDKLAKLPLDKLTRQMDKTMASLEETSKTAKTTLTTAQGTLTHTGETMVSARQTLKTLEPGSNGYYEFHTLMQELTNAARSVRQLTDYLEQHPESLIRGKEDNHE